MKGHRIITEGTAKSLTINEAGLLVEVEHPVRRIVYLKPRQSAQLAAHLAFA